MNILHIENSNLIRQTTKAVVEDLNHTYIAASNLHDAELALNQYKVDLMITGLEHDDASGEDLVLALSQSDNAHIPIIVLTSHDNLDIRTKMYQLGIVDYLLKKDFNSNRLKLYLDAIRSNYELLTKLKSLSLAVIDDSALTLKVIRTIFETNGITHVDYYSDITSLIKSKKVYDIYIVDMVLPESSGEVIISELKSKDIDCVIIMISSITSHHTISHVLNSGADDYIVKPFDSQTFLVRIKHHLKQHLLLKTLEEKNQELHRLSITDGLTNVYNHNYIITRLEEECSRAERYEHDLSIMLLDLDNFKSVNDTYGHPFGDEVLIGVASTLKSIVRESDIVGRYGGEEFLVILPEANHEEAQIVGQKILKAVRQLTFKHNGFSVTLSGGLAHYNHFSYTQLIKSADTNLFKAKDQGKNQIL